MDGDSALEKFKKEIERATLLKAIKFGAGEGSEVVLGDIKLKLEIDG